MYRYRICCTPLILLSFLLGIAISCRQPDSFPKDSYTQKDLLLTSTTFTPEGGFTSGIEGPVVDANGHVYVVNFGEQGTIGRVSPSGIAELFVKLPEGSVGNGIRIDKRGLLYLADYPQHNVLQIDPTTEGISVFAHDSTMNQPNDLAIRSDGVMPEIHVPPIANHVPSLRISWDESKVKTTPNEVREALIMGHPSIQSVGGAESVDIITWMLNPGEKRIVAIRLAEIFEAAS